MKKIIILTASILFLSVCFTSCRIKNYFAVEGQGSSAEIIYSATQSVMYESVEMFGFARAADRFLHGNKAEWDYLYATVFSAYETEELQNGDLIFSNRYEKIVIHRQGEKLYELGTEWRIVRENRNEHSEETASPIYTVKCTGNKTWAVSQDKENSVKYFDAAGVSDYTVTLWEPSDLVYDCYYVINGKCFYHSIDRPDYFRVDANFATMMVYSVLPSEEKYGVNMRSGTLDATVYNGGEKDVIESETSVIGGEKVIKLIKNGVEYVIRREI